MNRHNFILKVGKTMKIQFVKKIVAVLCSAAIMLGISGFTPVHAETENLIKDSSFEDSKAKYWGVVRNDGSSAKIAVNDGKLAFNVTKLGTQSYSLQLWHESVPIYQNGVYRLSYEISSTVDRSLNVNVQQISGSYQNYTSKELNVTSETQIIDYTFTMEHKTDVEARLIFHCGYPGASLPEHTIYIDNVVLELIDDSNVDYDSALPFEADILTDQVGYKPDGDKIAIFRNITDETEFSVVNADTAEVVYTGELYGMKPNFSADEVNWYGDFTAVTEVGSYYITCGELDHSYTFTIADDVYDNLLDDVVRMFYLQRCGCEVSDYTYGHAACHTGKAIIYGTNKTVDVSGGWHDAGDYGRYVVPGAKAVADLLFAYDANPGLFSDDAGIPESGNGVPDILDEARYEIEWMLKMQASSGGVYHKVTCQYFPGTVMPEYETDQLYATPISTTATADFCAVMAMAYEYYKDIDSKFANTCLEAAKDAWAFLEKNPDLIFNNPGDIYTGGYDDNDDRDERYWAAAQLLSATGDKKYETYIIENCGSDVKNGRGTTKVGEYGNFAILSSDNISDDSQVYKSALDAVIEQADNNVIAVGTNGYDIATSNFHWGSNMGIADSGVTLLLAYRLTGKEAYLTAAQNHLHFLLGRNPNAICFVSGYGTVSPENPHHRPSGVVGRAMPGMLAGGVNSYLQDSAAAAQLSDAPEAKCYIDVYDSYSTNEITIYWNSPLVHLLALTEEYQEASEIIVSDNAFENTAESNEIGIVTIVIIVAAVAVIATVAVIALKKRK